MDAAVDAATMVRTNFGQYTATEPLGEDALARRYRAVHRVLMTPHVIDVLDDTWSHDEAVVTSFVETARARATIRHRNALAIHDCGRARDGRWFVVAEALGGRTLAEYVRARGPIPGGLALELVVQIANALEAAHGRGLAHGALTTERVVVSMRDGNPHHVTVLDFGSAPGDVSEDVHALGAIACELVTGAAEDPTGCPEGWASTLLAARDGDPARRPRSARALVLALAEATPQGPTRSHGIDIVRAHARELLDIGNLQETVREPAPIAARASRYRRGERIGVGGMAEVFRGTSIGAEGFARSVAIKRVLPGLSDVPAFAAMFIEEARIASRLAHPNIVSVFDFDRDADDRLFLVMEYVDGTDLDEVLAAGALPPPIAIFVISEMLRGLGYAHHLPATRSSAAPDGSAPAGMKGVVHRDVSPHNILVSWEGAVKVSDFGIAKARDASEATASACLRGKPGYLAPEQASGTSIDGRADLFAVGIVLWEALTGTPLFVGSSQEAVAQVLFRAIPRPRNIRPDIPEDLEAVTLRLLERDREARFPTAAAAIAALAACADSSRDGRGELVRHLARHFTRDARGLRVRTRSQTRTLRPLPARARRSRASRVWLVAMVCCVIAGVGAGVLASL